MSRTAAKGSVHPLVAALAEVAAANPGASVTFVARERPFAREVLRELARAQGALAGWEGTTLRQLAADLAAPAFESAGLVAANDLDLQSAAETALAAGADALPAALQQQAASAGLRIAAYDAFAQLRIAGVDADTLRNKAAAGSPAHVLADCYAGYVTLLAERSWADAAEAFRHAIDAVERGVTNGSVVVEPGASDVTGLPLDFLSALVRSGAVLVPADDSAPDWATFTPAPEIYRAATPALEMRAALRRVCAEGLRWDDVEFAATDVDTYGVALASLGDELRIPYTLKEGVPLVRSRAGRAVMRYLRWLEEQCPDAMIRDALQQGVLPIVDASLTGADVARAIRAAEIGWGRSRWERAAERFLNGDWVSSRLEARDREFGDESGELREKRFTQVSAVAAQLVDSLLRLIPVLPERSDLGGAGVLISPGELATYALGWLTLVAQGIAEPGEQHALGRLRGRLTAIVGSMHERRAFTLAMAELRQGISDLRAFPSTDGAKAGRVSAPGAVHLTDITQAGCTGRRRIFVIGLDSDRVASARVGDPILDEETRRSIGDALPTLPQRAERKKRALNRALRGLRGRVTLSYAIEADRAGREASPAALLLDACRQLRDEPALTYDQFRKIVGTPEGAIPPSAALDARDVWLSALSSGTGLLDGRSIVREAFPALNRGLALHAGADAATAGEWHGLVPAAAGKLGPLATPPARMSPSSLELMGKCVLAWFYRYGLRLNPPDNVTYAFDEWLDAAQRGQLLHSVFERFVTEWKPRQDEIDSDEVAASLTAMLDDEIERWRTAVPPPSELMLERTHELLRAVARGFLAQERQHNAAAWDSTEVRFPRGGRRVLFPAGDGTVLEISGWIDRIDRLADGRLRIVDYKTGKSLYYRGKKGDAPLKGGRMLQPALYAVAAADLLGKPVGTFEYRFPGDRAPDDRVVLNDQALAGAPGLVASLISHLRTGAFIATDDSSDCRYCDFRPVCRVTGEREATRSPRADWAEANGEAAPEYAELRRRRTAAVAEDES